MRNPIRVFLIPALAFVAALAAAQGANQETQSPAPSQENAAPRPDPPSSASSGAALFPMPAVPDDVRASAPVPSSSAPSRGSELFPMPAIPDSTPAPQTQAESEMQTLIESAIGRNPTLTGADINVAVSAEGIELSGTVASIHTKLAASRLAKSYAGSRKVVDKIIVAANPTETHDEPSPARADAPGTGHQHP